jgi:hypothetical protein
VKTYSKLYGLDFRVPGRNPKNRNEKRKHCTPAAVNGVVLPIRQLFTRTCSCAILSYSKMSRWISLAPMLAFAFYRRRLFYSAFYIKVPDSIDHQSLGYALCQSYVVRPNHGRPPVFDSYACYMFWLIIGRLSFWANIDQTIQDEERFWAFQPPCALAIQLLFCMHSWQTGFAWPPRRMILSEVKMFIRWSLLLQTAKQPRPCLHTQIHPQILLCKKEIPHHIKISANAWSTKCRWNHKLIAQFYCTLRDGHFKSN